MELFYLWFVYLQNSLPDKTWRSGGRHPILLLNHHSYLLFLFFCLLGICIVLEKETERQTDRQTDRQVEEQREQQRQWNNKRFTVHVWLWIHTGVAEVSAVMTKIGNLENATAWFHECCGRGRAEICYLSGEQLMPLPWVFIFVMFPLGFFPSPLPHCW